MIDLAMTFRVPLHRAHPVGANPIAIKLDTAI